MGALVTPGALRVAVTRDEGAGGDLSRALAARGLVPVQCAAVTEAPSPEPERLADAARRLDGYDWLIVASRRAVEAIAGARNGAAFPSELRTAAVGDRTAAALIEHGASAPLVAQRPGSQALIAALRDADRWPERRCLLPRALDGGTEIAEALRRLGAQVDEVAAYRTVERPAAEIVSAWEQASPEAVVVASPSAARALVAALGADVLRRLRAVVAIGPTTRAALASLGVCAVSPPRADFESAAELLSGPTDVEREVHS